MTWDEKDIQAITSEFLMSMKNNYVMAVRESRKADEDPEYLKGMRQYAAEDLRAMRLLVRFAGTFPVDTMPLLQQVEETKAEAQRDQ